MSVSRLHSWLNLCIIIQHTVVSLHSLYLGDVQNLNPCLVHPVAPAINKKNATPLFATVLVVLSTLHYYMFRPTYAILRYCVHKMSRKLLYAILTDPSLSHINKNNISKIV
jgi:hypothetical protein